ncbi:MAG: zinc metalloprotease HtpX [Calditrichaeota bacterium]|nr:MAG: zinc metalloprotease HtpX [Calditrichota bacterium]
MHTLRVAFLMALLTVLLVILGGFIGGQSGAIMALIFAGVMNFFSYWFSDKMVLAMYRARQVTEAEAPELHAMVRRLSQQAGLPMPKVYIVPNETPNAFATGRNPEHAAVAVTSGILKTLNSQELEGVIAHELGHVKHRDILVSSIAATIAGAISYLAWMGQWSMLFGGFGGDDDDNPLGWVGALLAIILLPIAATMVQMAISRSREFAADEASAQITHNPLALASALRQLERAVQIHPAQVNPATSHMFIVNPLRGKSFASLFSTHPPTEERIARLEAMAYGRHS